MALFIFKFRQEVAEFFFAFFLIFPTFSQLFPTGTFFETLEMSNAEAQVDVRKVLEAKDAELDTIQSRLDWYRARADALSRQLTISNDTSDRLVDERNEWRNRCNASEAKVVAQREEYSKKIDAKDKELRKKERRYQRKKSQLQKAKKEIEVCFVLPLVLFFLLFFLILKINFLLHSN